MNAAPISLKAAVSEVAASTVMSPVTAGTVAAAAVVVVATVVDDELLLSLPQAAPTSPSRVNETRSRRACRFMDGHFSQDLSFPK